MDFKLLYKKPPQVFNLAFNFTTHSGRTTPIASMKNLTMKSEEKRAKKYFLAYKKKLCLAGDYLSGIYLKNLQELVKLYKLKSIGLEGIEKIRKFLDKKAVMIQKVVRGFLIRMKYEEVLIGIHKKFTGGLISELGEFAEQCYYAGRVFMKAVTKVQSTVRAWNYSKKNKESIIQTRKTLRAIREHLKILACVHYLKEKHSEYIQNRLKVIRKNLIKLRIREILQKFKIKFNRNKKTSKKSLNDSINLSASPRFSKFFLGEMIERRSISVSNTSDEEEDEIIQFKINKKRQGFNIMPYRPSVFSGVPVLIENKRKSQLWIERIDLETKMKVIDFKVQGDKLDEIKRRISMNRPNSESILNSETAKKQRNSFTCCVSSYIK